MQVRKYLFIREVLRSPEGLALILFLHRQRKLSKNLSFQFNNCECQLQGQDKACRLLAEGEPPLPLDDEKSVHQRVDHAKARQLSKPSWKLEPDYPWRKGEISELG